MVGRPVVQALHGDDDGEGLALGPEPADVVAGNQAGELLDVLVDLNIELAKVCASTAWVGGLLSAHQWLIASFPEQAQRDVWDANPQALACGSYAPATKAIASDGGYTLSGRWSFASGCDNAQWSLCAALLPSRTEADRFTPAFLLVPAEEITHSFAKRPVHMNGINLRDPIKPIDGKDAIETVRINLRQVKEQSVKTSRLMVAFLNHPNFGWGVRAEEMLLAEELKFFEVFNGHPGVRNYGDSKHASTERVWDITLALRLGKHSLPIVYGLATDDAHAYHEYGLSKVNPGRGWVMVRAPFLTAEAAVKGLDAGDFYASTGVVLNEVRRDGDTLKIAIRTEPGVTYKTEFVATLKGTDLTATPKAIKDKDGKETPVTGDYSPDIGKVVAESADANPTYTLTGKELYVRAKVTSSKPHPNPYAKGDVEVAWTQPVVP